MARDPYRYFRVEARELLDQLGKGALELDKGAAAPELIALMLRLAHTLKGAARVVKQREIADHAHAIEDALAPFREQATRCSRESDRRGAEGAGRDRPSGWPRSDPQSHGRRRQPAGSAAAVGRRRQPPFRIRRPSANASAEPSRTNVDEMDLLLDGFSEASVQLAALRRGTGTLQRSRRLAQLLEEQWAAPRAERMRRRRSEARPR